MDSFNLPYVDIIVLAILGIVLLLTLWLVFFEIRVSKFMRGKDAKNLESAINIVLKDNEQILAFRKDIEVALKNLNSRISSSARGIATVRFNAFGGRGESGAQSFATAFLDESGDGVVFSSIHTREGMRIYSKQVENLKSKHELSNEEKEAIVEANKKTK